MSLEEEEVVGRAQASRSRSVGTNPAAAAPRYCYPRAGEEASGRGHGIGEGVVVVVGVHSSRRIPQAEEVGIVVVGVVAEEGALAS